MYLGVLDGSAAAELDRFHAAMFELMRNSQNYSFLERHTWGCDQYSNQAANRGAALLALARLLDDRRRFEAALDGGDPSIPIALPWIALFNGAIYGEADTPHSCYFNSGPEGATSSPFFQTAAVAPGEVDDRYRNHGPGQGIGYSPWSALSTPPKFCGSPASIRTPIADAASNRSRWQWNTMPVSGKRPASAGP
jgi:hypothetical protein